MTMHLYLNLNLLGIGQKAPRFFYSKIHCLNTNYETTAKSTYTDNAKAFVSKKETWTELCENNKDFGRYDVIRWCDKAYD